MAQTTPNGAAITLAVETAVPGTFVQVGAQRDASFSESQGTLDVSSKDSRGTFRETGRYDSSFDLEFIYDKTDAAYVLLKASVRNGTKVRMLRTEDTIAYEEADFVITSLDMPAPDQDVAMVSISGEIDGLWVAA